jgi:hypothetical protein
MDDTHSTLVRLAIFLDAVADLPSKGIEFILLTKDAWKQVKASTDRV